MQLTYDTRHLPRSLHDWNRLIAELGATIDDTVETTWLELKGPLNLSAAEHKFKVARAVLSFANRDPAAAAPFLDGSAMIVIGIGGGKITGIPRIEDHDLIKALEAYLGDPDRSPRYNVHRHRVDDINDVVIIVVDAPRAGDRIYTLQKAFDKSYRGTVFARPSSASEPADPAASSCFLADC